jgi:hypothetical protein
LAEARRISAARLEGECEGPGGAVWIAECGVGGDERTQGQLEVGVEEGKDGELGRLCEFLRSRPGVLGSVGWPRGDRLSGHFVVLFERRVLRVGIQDIVLIRLDNWGVIMNGSKYDSWLKYAIARLRRLPIRLLILPLVR